MNNVLRKIITSLFVATMTFACTNAQVFAPAPEDVSSQQLTPDQLATLRAALNDPTVLKMVKEAANDPNSVIVSSPDLMNLMQQQVRLQTQAGMIEALKKLNENINKKEEKKGGWIDLYVVDSVKKIAISVVGFCGLIIFVRFTAPVWSPTLVTIAKEFRPVVREIVKEGMGVAGDVAKETAKSGANGIIDAAVDTATDVTYGNWIKGKYAQAIASMALLAVGAVKVGSWFLVTSKIASVASGVPKK